MDALNNAILWVMDFLLGWLLRLPSDVALFAVAIASAAILTLVRPLATNQDLLRRCRMDKKRLKELMRDARRRKDKSAFARCRATRGMVAWKALKAEGYPLLAAIVPIALLATWGFQRLEFHPPKVGEPVEVRAVFSASAVGELAYIVPENGLTAHNGWIREIGSTAGNGTPQGAATWIIHANGTPRDYTIKIPYKARTYERPLRIGLSTYSPPVTMHDDRLLSIEVKMKPVRLFGVVPGIPALLVAPWLVAYLLITIPSFLILKRLLKIC